jgi:hypothetical protein
MHVLHWMVCYSARISAPPVKLFEQSAFDQPAPWDVEPGSVDAAEMLQKLERRSKQHNAIVSSIAKLFGGGGRSVEYSDFIDLLVDGRIIIELKTVLQNPVKQVRAALDQLYYYRFAYRNQIKAPKLVAVFSARFRSRMRNLPSFLNDCGIGTAWMSGQELKPDATAAQMLFG